MGASECRAHEQGGVSCGGARLCPVVVRGWGRPGTPCSGLRLCHQLGLCQQSSSYNGTPGPRGGAAAKQALPAPPPPGAAQGQVLQPRGQSEWGQACSRMGLLPCWMWPGAGLDPSLAASPRRQPPSSAQETLLMPFPALFSRSPHLLPARCGQGLSGWPELGSEPYLPACLHCPDSRTQQVQPCGTAVPPSVPRGGCA